MRQPKYISQDLVENCLLLNPPLYADSWNRLWTKVFKIYHRSGQASANVGLNRKEPPTALDFLSQATVADEGHSWILFNEGTDSLLTNSMRRLHHMSHSPRAVHDRELCNASLVKPIAFTELTQ
jgi:hypothetical protein